MLWWNSVTEFRNKNIKKGCEKEVLLCLPMTFWEPESLLSSLPCHVFRVPSVSFSVKTFFYFAHFSHSSPVEWFCLLPSVSSLTPVEYLPKHHFYKSWITLSHVASLSIGWGFQQQLSSGRTFPSLPPSCDAKSSDSRLCSPMKHHTHSPALTALPLCEKVASDVGPVQEHFKIASAKWFVQK